MALNCTTSEIFIISEAKEERPFISFCSSPMQKMTSSTRETVADSAGTYMPNWVSSCAMPRVFKRTVLPAILAPVMRQSPGWTVISMGW